MKPFIFLSIFILCGCSNSDSKNEKQDNVTLPDNPTLFLKENNRFDIYYKKDTLSFYQNLKNEMGSEYIYDIYTSEDSVKCGRFVFGYKFEDSDTLNLYFDCTSISIPTELCSQWISFVKGSQSNLYFKK